MKTLCTSENIVSQSWGSVRCFLLLASLVFFISSCAKQTENHVVLGQGMGILNAPIFVTNNKNYWKEFGLKVEVKPFLTGRSALDSLIAGDLDIATIGDMPLVYGLFKHDNLRVIATTTLSNRDEKVIAREDAGIQKPGDLVGKKIGVIFGSAAEYYISRFLTHNGIAAEQVSLVNLRESDMVTALVRGDIDALVAGEPYVQNAKQRLVDNSVVFINEDIYTETWNLVVREDVYKNRPEIVQSLLKAATRGSTYLQQNIDESIGITASQLGLEQNMVRDIWPDFNFGIRLPSSLLRSLEDQGKWISDSGKISEGGKIPDFDKVVITDPLKNIAPDVVEIQ